MNRRLFLKNSLMNLAAAGVCSSLKLNVAQANASFGGQVFFVTLHMNGGADVTLGLDPQQHSNNTTNNDIFIEYTENEILKPTDNLKLGPACSPLLTHARDLATINGIFISASDNGHGFGQSYMHKGCNVGSAGEIISEYSKLVGSGSVGILDGRFIAHGTKRSPVLSLKDIINAANSSSGSYYPTENTTPIGRGAIATALNSMISNSRNLLAFDEAIKKVKAENSGSIPSYYVATEAFRFGLSNQASFNVPNIQSLDTHNQHEKNHLAEQTLCWQYVADTFAHFKSIEISPGVSLFDRTLFFVTSEFSRTPQLNTSMGKDHNPNTNSALIAGYGVNGGHSMGKSILVKRGVLHPNLSIHKGGVIDPTTGELATRDSQSTLEVTPEVVGATISEILGIKQEMTSTIRNAPSLENLIKA